jgi:branched-chain amino acid transport system ATP-binding protein
VTALLEVRGLCAGYGGQPVVHDLDLDVDAGTITVLLGPNGAGKTTIMRTLSGVIPALSGGATFDGRPLDGPQYRRARRGLGYVAEERSVFSRLTVRANLALATRQIETGVEHFPELTALLDRRAGDLSGGEQQMLTLARALSRQPTLLLVDELSLGLAPLVVNRLLRAVRSAADRGLAVLMVEQHAHKALDVADRAAVLSRGRIVLDGTGADLRERFDEVERAYLHGHRSSVA